MDRTRALRRELELTFKVLRSRGQFRRDGLAEYKKTSRKDKWPDKNLKRENWSECRLFPLTNVKWKEC
jgi:hypothetical protein